MGKSKKSNRAKVKFPQYLEEQIHKKPTLIVTEDGAQLRGDRVLIYAREIDKKNKPIVYSGNHRGQMAIARGDVICINEIGIKGGRKKERKLK